MNRWYFWVLAPVMIATAVVLPFVAAPPSRLGQAVVYIFSATLLLATVGLADARRFQWALRCVAAIVLATGVAYFVHEFREWRAGERSGSGGRRSDPSLWNASLFLLVFGIPALRYLMAGRSGTVVDEIAVARRPARRGEIKPSGMHSGARPPFHDDVLGAVQWDDDEGCWVARSIKPGAAFRILIAGDARPDARLVPHARDLLMSPDVLLAVVPAVLDAAAREIPEAAHEILGLHVESVALMWPDLPDNGMVYFDGRNTDERVWRCDYIGRRLQSLGFDD